MKQSWKEKSRRYQRVLSLCMAVALLFTSGIGWGSLTVKAEDSMGLSSAGRTSRAMEKETKTYTIGGMELVFWEQTGDLIEISLPGSGYLSEPTTLSFDGGVYVDFAYDGGDGGWNSWGAYLRNTLFYQNHDNLHTYELPSSIQYNPQTEYPRRHPDDVSYRQITSGGNPGIEVSYVMKPYDEATVSFRVTTEYLVHPMGYVEMASTLENINSEPVIINGAASVISGMQLNRGAMVEFPGNIPYKVYAVDQIPNEYSIIGEYASPLIHFFNGSSDVNIIFANEHEKWAPSITKSQEGAVEVINLACTLDKMQPNEVLPFGRQFIQLTAAEQAYQAAQDLYTDNGWTAPVDGVKGVPVYSGHPAGVSDNNFADAAGTLDDYQAELQKIKDLGFDNYWMLPVFEHPDSGGSVYLPYNMEHIDSRYSKRVADSTNTLTLEEKRALAYDEMKDFGQAVEALGMNFMLDYVPHGPYMYGKDEVIDPDNMYDNPWMDTTTKQWASMNRWWEYADPAYRYERDEWNAYAFDFANEDYLQYMHDLVYQQAVDFSMAGTRIDAVMGSLPNWRPYGNNRPSQTGLYGGAEMTKTMRDAYLRAGKKPIVLPENNNPTPYFAQATDLFYDMPFHRVTLDSRKEGVDEIEFAAIIAHWLKTEKMSSTKGMEYGRFLENHDTVAPWYPNFDGARATTVYGEEKARALWVLLSTIDGAPIIYQNDEHGNEAFFTELMEMRKTQFGSTGPMEINTMDIEYYNDATSGIVAFRRFDTTGQKLVLVNLLDQVAARDFSTIDVGGIRFHTATQNIVYGDAEIQGDTITLAPYQSVVIDLQGGEAFQGENMAPQFIVTEISKEMEEQFQQYREQAKVYPGLNIKPPAVSPVLGESAHEKYDPVEDYSGTTPDGDFWKYMYLPAGADTLEFCETADGNAVGVWRAKRTGSGEWDYEWAGVGRNSNHYPERHYFELDTNMGAEVYGVLVFVAPTDGVYTIPAFDMLGDGESETALLAIHKNDAMVYKSQMMEDHHGRVRIDEQAYEMEAGDVLMFYTVRMDNAYSFVQLDRMTIRYSKEGTPPIDPEKPIKPVDPKPVTPPTTSGGKPATTTRVQSASSPLPRTDVSPNVATPWGSDAWNTRRPLTEAQALQAAKHAMKDHSPGKTLQVKVYGKTMVPLEVLQALAAFAEENKIDLRLHLDTVSEKAVVSRITIDPTRATQAIYTGVKASVVQKEQGKDKDFSIEMAHAGAFGSMVTMSVKLPEELQGQDLMVYHWNEETKTQEPVQTPFTVDDNGYLQIKVDQGESLLVSKK